jgi:hypothetical protein
MTASRPARQRLAIALPLAVLLPLTGCTAFPASSPEATDSAAGGEAGVPAGVVEHRDQPWTPADETTTLGSSDEELPPEDEIPQGLHVGTIDPISAEEMVILDGSGSLEIPMQVIDPATGAATARIVSGPGIWNPVIHPFVGETADDPAVLAAEVWRPRGSRGAADFTISTYAGDLLEPDEIVMPDYVRPHSRWGSSVVTDDGRYFVFWDDALYGPRVFDLEAGQETGALELVGCGPFTWADGHDVYSVCENTRELIHLQVQDDGSLEEVGRAEVLPDDFVSNRLTSYADDADKALLVSANGDVFVFDLADGLPDETVAPVGNAGLDSGRFSEYVINSSATSVAISYTDSEIHPHSARSGDTAQVVLYDAATFGTVAALSLATLQLSSIGSHAYSVDGDTLYVHGQSLEDAEGETQLVLVGVDAATGAETSRVVVEDFVGDAGHMLTPQRLG